MNHFVDEIYSFICIYGRFRVKVLKGFKS